MFIIKCLNCGNEIEIPEGAYRVRPTDHFSIIPTYSESHVEIECNVCDQSTVIK